MQLSISNISLLLLLLLLPEHCKSLFHSNYKTMLSKAKAYYKSKFGKDKTWHFLGHDLSEYPGSNEKYREVNKKKWDEYYDCLKIQNDSLGPHRSVMPEAIQGFEASSISFDCKICLSPRERAKIDVVEWYWAPLNSEHLTPIEYTEHILLSPEDKTLTLYNLGEAQTGQYMCRLGGSLTAPYFLTVVNSSVNVTEVHSRTASHGPYPQTQEGIPLHNLTIDTIWGEWSPCSKCGKVGKRHKFGYCVIFIDNQEKLLHEKINTTETSGKVTKGVIQQSTTITTSWEKRALTEFEQTLQINITPAEKQAASILERDLELLKIFSGGVPCLSHILPDSIKNLTEIKNRVNEIMIGYCKVSCPNEEIFEVRDKQGNVLERANNSAGIYSMLQGMPPVEPPVERMLQYERIGEHIVISCPGNLNSDMPLLWQIGAKKLVAELIAKESMGRIYISVMDKVNIKKAKVSDSNTYSCWQNNNLAGTVRLVIEKKVKLTFNHHIMLFGMVVILSVFLYVFVKAFFGRKYAQIKN